MKNKIFIGSLIATGVAFIFYVLNLNYQDHAVVKIVGHDSSQVIKEKSGLNNNDKLKKYSHIMVSPGSDQKVVHKIEKVMGLNPEYQVTVKNLSSPKYAKVTTAPRAKAITKSAKFLLLLVVYYQEQTGKFTNQRPIKIKKADHVKKDHLLQAGVGYSISYLRQALEHGNQTAINVLMRKIGSQEIATVLQKFGTEDTSIYQQKNRLLGRTTVTDLVGIISDLYQGKVLKRHYADLALKNLNYNDEKSKLLGKINNNSYILKDHNLEIDLVTNKQKVYCLGVWSENYNNWSNLGLAVNELM